MSDRLKRSFAVVFIVYSLMGLGLYLKAPAWIQQQLEIKKT